MPLQARASFAICAAGVGRTVLSPTWSDPEGSSHNDFVPGRPAPTFRFTRRSAITRWSGGASISEFEFLFSFFGLLLGLTVAEVTVKFADAIDAHVRRPIGLLTPLLALFVLLDITTFWLFSWSLRDWLHLSWRTVFTALAMAVTYFLAASLVFPRSEGTWPDLDAHYWTRKRFVVSGVLAVNIVLLGLELSRVSPEWSDGWFFFYQATYYGPLAVLLASRNRRLDFACLIIINASLLIGAFELFPSSRWAEQVGVAFQASTSAPAAPK